MDCVERAFAKDKHRIEAKEEEDANGDEQVAEKEEEEKNSKKRVHFVCSS